MAACWPLQVPPSPKSVLISLADNANDAGVCWPSIPKICERTCLGRTAVINAIKWLEDAGLVTADRSNGRHTTYQIDLSAVKQGALFDVPKPVREANQSAMRTSTAGGPNQSARRTGPVREADSNRHEPSGTVKSSGATASSAKRGCRLPADWQPRSDDLTFAVDRLGQQADEEIDKFRDHWKAAPGSKGVKLDWDATFRNWIRNARIPQGRTTHEAPRKLSSIERIEANVRRGQQHDADGFIDAKAIGHAG